MITKKLVLAPLSLLLAGAASLLAPGLASAETNDCVVKHESCVDDGYYIYAPSTGGEAPNWVLVVDSNYNVHWVQPSDTPTPPVLATDENGEPYFYDSDVYDYSYYPDLNSNYDSGDSFGENPNVSGGFEHI